MACNDRQLSQAQRTAGYDQQRTGVPMAVRPFSGSATIENLIDYLNRELVPGVRQTRSAINDVFLQVADNAPSANPLAFYFSTSTVAADPTVGRIRLNATPQNTASIIRVSQSNGRLVDVTPWLDVMSGGPTIPLGTVTLMDAINPGRFLRWDLNTMTDQGAYWDLGVTFIEGSTADPFVDDEAVTLGFIAGVSAAGSTVPVGSISPIARDTFLGNIGTTTAPPAAVPLADVDSTSIIYDATSHTFQRAALTGFATATQNSNATSSAEPIVTYSASANMSAERVTTSSTSITVDIATAGQIEFRSAAKTGAISQAANANATLFAGILDNGAAENDRTSLDFITTNDVALAITDNSGSDKLEIRATLAAGTTQNEGTSGAVTVNAGVKVLAITTNISISGFARSGGNVDGDRFWVRCNDGIECELQHATGTLANQMSLPYAENLIVPGRGMIEFRYEGSWRAVSTGNKGRLLRVTTYTSGSGTHTYLSDCRRANVRGKGGGGGGGGAGTPDGNVGSGGGEGGFFELDITSVPTSSAYAVGAGGTAGASTPSPGTAGGAGGDTTFHDGSTTRTAGGGTGGQVGGILAEPGDGGSAPSVSGTVIQAHPGAPGQHAYMASSGAQGYGGHGGGSGAGRGGFGGTDATTSEAGEDAAANSGAGGGGAARPASPARAGGAGGSGWIVVKEYT
jgi:hypothetical protein